MFKSLKWRFAIVFALDKRKIFSKLLKENKNLIDSYSSIYNSKKKLEGELQELSSFNSYLFSENRTLKNRLDILEKIKNKDAK